MKPLSPLLACAGLTAALLSWSCSSAPIAPDTVDAGKSGPDATTHHARDAGADATTPKKDARHDVAVEAAIPPQKPPYDWVGVLGTGQSLAVGATPGPTGEAQASLATTQTLGNLKLADYGPAPNYPILPDSGNPSWTTVPLVEPFRVSAAGVPGAVQGAGAGYGDGQYPGDIYGETSHWAMANTLSEQWKARGGAGEYVTAHSEVGWAGHCLVDIDKEADGGTRSYLAGLNEAQVFANLARAAGKTVGYGGVILTHGECDAAASPDYGAGLYRLWQDYNNDLQVITGQSADIVLLASQESSVAGGLASSAVQLWQAGVAHPGQVICTGPKYQYEYWTDMVHLTPEGYERLGEKYAEVWDIVVDQQKSWLPLQPTTATLVHDTITLAFHVPNPPLEWDETLPTTHQMVNTAWATGRGFEVYSAVDGGLAPVPILSVTIEAPSQVILTLATTPAPGASLTVGYALTQDGVMGNFGGTAQGLMGQLRDSDDFIGADAETLSVVVTQGSTLVTAATPGAFLRRAGRDDVSSPGLAGGAIVEPFAYNADAGNVPPDQLTLSKPWAGGTGATSLSFHHDQHNYCVHFAMPVTR